MKSLNSFIKEPTISVDPKDNKQDPVLEQEPIVDISTPPITPEEIPQSIVINDYMIHDSNFVGYETQTLQESIYRIATFGILSKSKSILDLGCGRADLYSYVNKIINPDINYYGVDVNNLMLEIAKKKYPPSEKFNLIQANYYDGQIELPICDWVFNLTNLSVPYGFHNEDKIKQFTDLLEVSLNHCTQGVVFMLINDRNNYPGYYQFKVADIVNLVEGMNLKYGIDNSDNMTDLFKLIILK